MNKVLVSLAAVMVLLLGYMTGANAQFYGPGYVSRPFDSSALWYPSHKGFPPSHWDWRSPVMSEPMQFRYPPPWATPETGAYFEQGEVAYPADDGFPPWHSSPASPVMGKQPQLGVPAGRFATPSPSYYGSGYTELPTDEGFPPGHLFVPSIVMNPRSLYVYPGPWRTVPSWRY